MKVYGYTRVSSDEQAKSGLSPETQEEKVRLFCQLHGFELVELLYDDARSAGSLKRRPGFARILAGLRAGEADGLVVLNLERVTRSTKDWAHLADRYFSERAGKHLMTIEMPIDTRTAGGRLVLNVLVSTYQWERERTGERTRDMLQRKIQRGEPAGRVPRGLRIVRKQTRDRTVAVGVEVDPESDGLRVAARVHELRGQDMTLRAIAARLNEEGFRPERGRAYYPSTVSGILKNQRLAAAVKARAA